LHFYFAVVAAVVVAVAETTAVGERKAVDLTADAAESAADAAKTVAADVAK
jgi:hypothetical protein